MASLSEKIKKHHEVWKIDLLIIFVFIAIVVIFSLWAPKLSSREVLDQLILKYGAVGPLVIIVLVILEVVIAPAPGNIIPFIAGAIYGIFLGALYTWIGNVIGSSLAFWIARKLGRPIVRKIISEQRIRHFDNFLHRNKFLVWIVYILPVFPVDLISYAVGFSTMKFRRFLLIITICFIPYLLILNYFGHQILFSSGAIRLVYAGIIMLIVLIGVSVERIISKKE